MAFGKKKTIRIEFLEAKEERLIGYDELPLREVPEGFKDDTWVEIDGNRWKVVRVNPETARKAKKAGLLTVHVDLVERRMPIVEEEIPVIEDEVKEAPVYRNPSRADQMPRMSGKRGDLNLLEIATYEWRDIEFTVTNNRSTAKEVFGKIEELILLNSTFRDNRTFYTRQYDRYDMFAPLRGTKLPLELVIMDYFPEARAVEGMTFMGSDQVADSTFVFRVASGICFYGQEFDDIIRYFALTRPDKLDIQLLRNDAAKIAALMKRKDLILVDWQRREIVEGTEEAVYEYFLKGFADHAVAVAQGMASQQTIPIINLEKPVAIAPHLERESVAPVLAVVEIEVQPQVDVPPAVLETTVMEPTVQITEDSASHEHTSTTTEMKHQPDTFTPIAEVIGDFPDQPVVPIPEIPATPEQPSFPDLPRPEEIPATPNPEEVPIVPEPLTVPETPAPEEVPASPEPPVMPEENEPESKNSPSDFSSGSSLNGFGENSGIQPQG